MDKDEFLRVILQKGKQLTVNGKVFITPRNNSVPERLFKYRSANEFLFSLLRDKAIYHASVESFNDPLEGIKAYRLEFTVDDIDTFFMRMGAHVMDESRRQAQHRQIVEHFTREQERFEEIVRQQFFHDLEQFGISCFTTKHDNFLMWSHYGDNHRGVCLEFDFSKEIERLQGDDVDLANSYLLCIRKVEYAGTIPVVKLRDLFAERFSPIYSKSQRFESEEEYRSIRAAVGSYGFVAECLRRVYVGLSTPQDTIDRIRQTLIDSGFDGVVMKRMVRKPGSYDLEEADIA